MTKNLVFMDIDDTLVNNHQEISKFTKDTIKQNQSNTIFYVATGRMFTSAKVIADEINAKIVASNGGIFQNRSEIIQFHLGENNLKNIYHILEEKNLSAFFFSNHQVFYNRSLPKYFKHSTNNRIASPNPGDYLKVNLPLLLQHSDDIINGIIIEDTNIDILESAKKELKDTTDLNVSSSFKNNIELIPDNVSKATAIQQIQNEYNITPENTFTFGDGENDIEMFNMSKYSVAMGNASDSVKSHANFITDSYLNDGIAKFLQEHLN